MAVGSDGMRQSLDRVIGTALLTALFGAGCAVRTPRVEISLSAWPQILETVLEERGFRMGESGHERFLGRGWYDVEQDRDGRFFRWAVGDTVEVHIPVAEPRDLTFRLRWSPPPVTSGELQGIAVRVNGVEVVRKSITSRRFHWFDIAIPRRAVHTGVNTVALIPSLRVTSAEDTRPLRFCVREIAWGGGRAGAPPSGGDETEWRRVAAESGVRMVSANESMRLMLAVPHHSTLKVRCQAVSPGRPATFRITGETAGGEEMVLWSGRIVGTDKPRQIQAPVHRDLRALALNADGPVAVHDVTLAAPARQSKAPTLVLVTVDGLGAALGGHGRMAQWAEAGMSFTHAFLPSPAIIPSYCSLMTGFYPFVHGISDDGAFRLSDAIPRVAVLLRERGYRCAGAVSHSLLGPERSGLAKGFASFSYPLQGVRSAQETADEAVHAIFRDWVDLCPGFLWLHLVAPSTDADDDSWDLVSDDELRARAVARIDSCVDMVGRALHQVGLDRRMAMVVCGGPSGEIPSPPGIRHELADSAIGVPLWLRPAEGGAAQTVLSAVSLVDIAPTLLDMAGVPPPVGVHGRTLLTLAAGETERGPVFCEARGGRATAVVRPPLKFIQAADLENPPQGLPGGMFLVDTASDPAETLNLVSSRVAEATDMAEALLRLVGETIPRFRPVPVPQDTDPRGSRGE